MLYSGMRTSTLRSRHCHYLALLLLAGCAETRQTPAATTAAPVAAPAPPPAALPPAVAPTPPPPGPQRVAQVIVPPALQAVVDAKDRSPEDRKMDEARHAAETLAFFGISAGMKVADLGAGTGYTTELLARAVGPTGVVYGQNSKFILDRFAETPWSARLKKPAMKHVVRVNREFDDPLPPEARELDVVFDVLFYHDTVWMGTDRDKMNRAIFAALKPGGVYAIIDHSGREGTGIGEVKTLHRIEESVVQKEIEKAGFRLARTADFLRNSSDTRDWNDAPFAAADRRGKSDRFVLLFVKPE